MDALTPEDARPAGRRRAIVVLGMHRNGTSAMTRLLALSGAALPAPLIGPAPDNPQGYWEPADMVALDDGMLDAAGARWDEVFVLPSGEGAVAGEVRFRERAETFLAANRSATGPLVLKDPRASLLARFWGEALKATGVDPFFVIMVRHPLEVADSLAARDGLTRERSVLLWARHMLAAERDTRDGDRLFVSYDALLSDWRGVLARLESALGMPLPWRTPDAGRAIDLFLSNTQRHHRTPMPEPAAWPDIWPGWRDAYLWFEAAARGECRDPAVLAAAEEQLRSFRAMFGPLVDDLRRERAAHEHAAEALRAEAEFWRLQAGSNETKLDIFRRELDLREREAALRTESCHGAVARLEATLDETRRAAALLEAKHRALQESRSPRWSRAWRSVARRLRRP